MRSLMSPFLRANFRRFKAEDSLPRQKLPGEQYVTERDLDVSGQ